MARGAAIARQQAHQRQDGLAFARAVVQRMATASLTADAQEGIAAFLEKRVANYVQLPAAKPPRDT